MIYTELQEELALRIGQAIMKLTQVDTCDTHEKGSIEITSIQISKLLKIENRGEGLKKIENILNEVQTLIKLQN